MSLVIGAAGLRAEIRSEAGARIVGLRSGDREWLAPSSAADLAAAHPAGATFVRPGMGGWDEVAPTVAATVLRDGTVLPDHGERWTRAWTVRDATEDLVWENISLRTLPIVLDRMITTTEDGLRLHYVATCTGAGPTPFLWSAHPQFAARPGTVLQLDGHHPAAEIHFPGDGLEMLPLGGDVLAALAPGTGVKAFLPAGSRCAGARLVDPDGAWLALTWDPEQVPYLGLWWDNGLCAERPVIAIEPTTGHGDDAAAALAADRVLMLQPGERYRWWIDVTAGRE